MRLTDETSRLLRHDKTQGPGILQSYLEGDRRRVVHLRPREGQRGMRGTRYRPAGSNRSVNLET
jgi:hypothetical protein